MLIGGAPIAGTPIASDLLEQAGATVVADSPGPAFISAPAQRTSHRAVAGYALAFAAAGALTLAAPGDAIGSTNYTVGTQRAAVASAQPAPRIFRSNALFVVVAADPVPAARIEAAPQVHHQPAPYVHGTAPASVAPGTDTPVGRYRLTVPQYPEQGRPWVRGTAPESVAEVFALARSFAAEQDVWNVIAPQFFGRPIVEGAPPPSGTDTIGALSYTVGTHRAAWAEANGRGTWVHGTPPDSVAAPEQPRPRFLAAIPQPPIAGAGFVHGPTPAPLPAADTPIGRFEFAYQAVIDPAQGRVWGRRIVEAVIGTDTAVGVFRVSAQQFFMPPAYGRVQRMDVDAIGPPPVVAAADEWIIRARRRGRR